MKLNQLFSQVAVKEFYIMAINPKELNDLLHKPFDVANSKNIATYILQLMGLSDFQFIYTQNTLKKITDTTKKGMFVDDTEFADRKSAFDILNNQYNINSKHQQIILPRLFVIKQYSRSNVIWLNKLGINYEDDPLINGFYPLGLDFVVCQGRFLVVISNQDNLRVLELNHAQELNSTQIEILSQWQALFTSESNKKLLHTSLWNSLNLESVNKKFYIDIIQNFANLKQHLITNNLFDNNQAVIFTNRLIGRLLFCYFLIKKDFIPTEYLELDQQNDNEYYHNKLSQLFFAVLNTPINERSHTDRTTPYLNGGLFERKDTDIANVTFPDNYFSNLFAIFRKYNWTVDESLSNYEVMAIDPEMLGRIFENLLAEINVDNDGSSESARKAKGAFYTPRVIVDYMCKESLRQYLLTNSSEHSHSIINRLLDDSIGYLTDQKRNWTDDIKPYKEQLTNLLDKITVFDPACGSGAFPMGMLQLILHTYERLGDKQKPSNRKIKIIENSIFGADIEPNAIEIARLRAWLSIVVDEDKQDIEPLPNLDFKFVCCNSLIKLETKGQSNLADNLGTVEKLQELQHNYFRARTYKTKKDIRQQYHDLIEQSRSQNSLFGKSKYLEQIESYHPFETKNVCQFYDNKFMFGISDGFDVVIGNPPYVQIQKFSGQQCQTDWQNQNYATFAKTGDIYALFIEKGVSLLKTAGVLAYITSNKWMRAGYGKSLRNFLATKTQPTQLIDFGGYQVFKSATVDSNILVTKNSPYGHDFNACTIKDNYSPEIPLNEYFKQHSQTMPQVSGESWVISSALEQQIKNKIEAKGVPLKDWDINIYRGVLTGLNEAFIIDTETKERLCAEDPKSAEIIKPILRGRDIKRYQADWAGLWLINSQNNPPINIENYPAIKNHLDAFYTQIEKRQDKGVTPYNLRNCAYLAEFEKEKIVWARLMRVHKTEDISFPRFSLAKEHSFVVDSLCFITANHSIKYLLAVLNSKYAANYFYKNIAILDNGGMQMRQQYIENLLVPQISPQEQQPFIDLVDKIMEAKKTGADTSEYEAQIDLLVYQLYDLTPEEIALIESK